MEGILNSAQICVSVQHKKKMYKIKSFVNNDDVKIMETKGPFRVIEYQRDLSVAPLTAQRAYYSSMMNVRKKQVICDLTQANITTQAGAMNWMVENVSATTGLKGAGDLLKKALRGVVTKKGSKEAAVTRDKCVEELRNTNEYILRQKSRRLFF